MIQDVVLWTCAGGMKVVYLSQFAKMIPHEVVQNQYVDVARSTQAFWDPTTNSEFVPPQPAQFERLSLELKPFHKITQYDKMRANKLNHGYRMFQDQICDAAMKMIEDEIKVLVAQRNPTFFMKDLSMENVEKLSEEYAKKMGSDACGVNIQLSPYQKFFVIVDPNDFKFYTAHLERFVITEPGPVTEYVGKLADLRPDKWQMGRYEHLTYMKELSAMRMYSGGTNESGR